MKAVFDESRPIFQQIFEMIADDIVDGELHEGEQIPSTTEISKFYQVNRATVQKGLSMLVNAGYAYKQRGVGVFVAEGAKYRLLAERKEEFYIQYVKPMLEEGRRIQMTMEEIKRLIEEDYDD
ncbi:GntR family transcriptional regulator [Salicibibacter kimchii]|uniref:GntR family transcriptional regulator n=1 Tax=Salicibibacter kimchii TaxID=2099786 RepID=A0A345C2F2_9BACI|nr:GntR family transcriptional regulator [Salicibibacter kimchii]AXF57383.1 GntR family transcriptional regulator [Salicibibacter kimchii]